jgi:GTP-binding protein
MKVLSADFVKTATRQAEWPPEPLPELAFVGRSNVGKSSMLNALCRRDRLARVSSTPGRTQALQFFRLQLQPAPAARPLPISFCDLPGYGYAKVPRGERDKWARMIEEYLEGREALRAVVLIVDGRHPPQDSDREALAFLVARGRPVVVAATKVDKLAKSHRFGAVRAAEKALGLPEGSVVPFSAVEGTGTDALWKRIRELVRDGAPPA